MYDDTSRRLEFFRQGIVPGTAHGAVDYLVRSLITTVERSI
jgi:hypothetical protein